MIGEVLRTRYELTQEMSEGPIMCAYRSRDRGMGREVVVRVFMPPYAQEAGFVEAFRSVAEKVAKVAHPSLEKVLDFDDDAGRPFMVSELTSGQTLSERVKRMAPFSPHVSIATALSICSALEALHSSGIVHGDVRPGNVTVLPDGTAKVAMAGAWESYSASRTAGAVMLPEMAPYLAPEVSAGSMPAPTSDIYATGAVLFELLTGRLPYGADTAVAMAMKHSTAPVPSVRVLNSSVPAVLDEIVRKCLAKSPSERYASVRGLISDLTAVQEAMRFGKTLKWPIRETSKDPQPQPVAPKMSAARQKPKPQPSQQVHIPERSRGPSDGVPGWLMWLVYAAIVVILALIGSFVFFNLNKPKLVRVPNIIGLSASDANQRLQELNLGLHISRKLVSEQYPEGQIVKVQPPPNEYVRQNSRVSVIVSAGSKFVELPDLRGRTLDEARTLLADLGLELDEGAPVSKRDLQPGTIAEQRPERGRKVERGSRIRVNVADESAGRSSGGSAARNDYTLKVKMPEDREATAVRVEMTDDNGTRTVYEASHSGGDSFEVRAEGVGEEAMFRIFFDNVPVKQVLKKASEAAQGGER